MLTCYTNSYEYILFEEREQEELEDLLAKRFPRGKGKYKGKFLLKFFSFNKIGHIASRFPNNDKKENPRKFNDKNKKVCYLPEEGVTDEESDGRD